MPTSADRAVKHRCRLGQPRKASRADVALGGASTTLVAAVSNTTSATTGAFNRHAPPQLPLNPSAKHQPPAVFAASSQADQAAPALMLTLPKHTGSQHSEVREKFVQACPQSARHAYDGGGSEWHAQADVTRLPATKIWTAAAARGHELKPQHAQQHVQQHAQQHLQQCASCGGHAAQRSHEFHSTAHPGLQRCLEGSLGGCWVQQGVNGLSDRLHPVSCDAHTSAQAGLGSLCSKSASSCSAAPRFGPCHLPTMPAHISLSSLAAASRHPTAATPPALHWQLHGGGTPEAAVADLALQHAGEPDSWRLATTTAAIAAERVRRASASSAETMAAAGTSKQHSAPLHLPESPLTSSQTDLGLGGLQAFQAATDYQRSRLAWPSGNGSHSWDGMQAPALLHHLSSAAIRSDACSTKATAGNDPAPPPQVPQPKPPRSLAPALADHSLALDWFTCAPSSRTNPQPSAMEGATPYPTPYPTPYSTSTFPLVASPGCSCDLEPRGIQWEDLPSAVKAAADQVVAKCYPHIQIKHFDIGVRHWLAQLTLSFGEAEAINGLQTVVTATGLQDVKNMKAFISTRLLSHYQSLVWKRDPQSYARVHLSEEEFGMLQALITGTGQNASAGASAASLTWSHFDPKVLEAIRAHGDSDYAWLRLHRLTSRELAMVRNIPAYLYTLLSKHGKTALQAAAAKATHDSPLQHDTPQHVAKLQQQQHASQPGPARPSPFHEAAPVPPLAPAPSALPAGCRHPDLGNMDASTLLGTRHPAPSTPPSWGAMPAAAAGGARPGPGPELAAEWELGDDHSVTSAPNSVSYSRPPPPSVAILAAAAAVRGLGAGRRTSGAGAGTGAGAGAGEGAMHGQQLPQQPFAQEGGASASAPLLQPTSAAQLPPSALQGALNALGAAQQLPSPLQALWQASLAGLEGAWDAAACAPGPGEPDRLDSGLVWQQASRAGQGMDCDAVLGPGPLSHPDTSTAASYAASAAAACQGGALPNLYGLGAVQPGGRSTAAGFAPSSDLANPSGPFYSPGLTSFSGLTTPTGLTAFATPAGRTNFPVSFPGLLDPSGSADPTGLTPPSGINDPSIVDVRLLLQQLLQK